MRQALGPGALGRPRGIGWRGRWEGGSGWGTHVNPWLIHINVWQKPLQYCKVISLQLIKINGEKKVDWQKAWEIKCWASMPKFNYWTHFFPLQNNKNMLKHEDPLVVSCFLCAVLHYHTDAKSCSHLFSLVISINFTKQKCVQAWNSPTTTGYPPF